MTLDPAMIHKGLVNQIPQRLDRLPRKELGIYALHDHNILIRYIGSTQTNFFDRIGNKHVTGSEGSHKFSTAYNSGKMWREPDDNSPDAVLAKRVRTAFIREHCRATFVTVLRSQAIGIIKIENKVRDLMALEMRAWNQKKFPPVEVLPSLVENVVDELDYTPEQRAAIQRQAERCVEYQERSNTSPRRV